MIDLRFHKVFWCAQHGHPALSLQVVGSDQCMVLALGTEDAMALAASSPYVRVALDGPGRWLAAVAGELGGRFAAVQLRIGGDAVVRAFLHVDSGRGAAIVPAHIVDGLALALRQGLPLWMADGDFAEFIAATTAPAAADRHGALEPYRGLVESLDLDGFGGQAANG